MMVDEDVERLVSRAATGEEAAWQELWQLLQPRLLLIVAQPRFLGPLGQSEDDRHNIVVAVLGRLRENNFYRLNLYLAARERSRNLGFMTWLRVVAKRVGIDYMRGHPDYVDHRRRADGGSVPGSWRQPATMPAESRIPGARPHATNRGTARELLAFAAKAIPEQQRLALERWIENDTFVEIAATLGLAGPLEAERLVRAAIERLRRHFREPDPDSTP